MKLPNLEGRVCHGSFYTNGNTFGCRTLVFRPIESDLHYVVLMDWWKERIGFTSFAVEQLLRDAQTYKLASVAADPNNDRRGLAQLKAAGISTFEFTQSAVFYHEPIEHFLEARRQGFVLGRNGTIKKMLKNVRIMSTLRGYKYVDHTKSDRKSSWRFCTLLMAFSEVLFHPPGLLTKPHRDYLSACNDLLGRAEAARTLKGFSY